MKIKKITPQIAALYLGQKCTVTWITNYKPWVVGDTYDTDINHERIGLLEDEYILIEPHLRGLDSITEDEAIHIHDDFMGFLYAGIRPCIEWICLGFPGNSSFYQDARGYPTVWLYLLSKGFDLFGLIDAGLAKDISSTL